MIEELTPRQIVAELDKYIVGQAKAKRAGAIAPRNGLPPRPLVPRLHKYIAGQARPKRAVAIALRTRYRRRLLPLPMRDEVIPKNILMIGPTGGGKPGMARRAAGGGG